MKRRRFSPLLFFTYEEEEVLPLAVLGWYAAPGRDLVHGLCLVNHVRHRRVVHLKVKSVF
jgi:hypothetical protein